MNWLLFLPRFWGSYESRWELGHYHYAHSPQGRTLCGKPIGEYQNEERVTDDAITMTGGLACKTCRRMRLKRIGR
jgi:hypothetical protein